MNTELYKMMVDAEGRWLTDGELRRIEDYAAGLEERIAFARRVEEAESRIVMRTMDRCMKKHPDYAAQPQRVANGHKDFKFTLRYIAHSHVRGDLMFFRENFVGWMVPVFQVFCSPEELLSFFGILEETMREELDPSDMQLAAPYLAELMKGLGA